ncbi:MAG: potassium transporter TrkH [Candidatus Pelagibacter sp. TMED196]|nr:MAG: potassium transporter TrkH [Candidatus Pelagibacter sp. TMED196]|tara:strand:- start:2815 stop:4260 length:1446 start_codon:yes stop_codon:yes gene_type:complete
MITNKTVFFVVGILLLILGIFMMIPYGIQILYKENSNSFFSSSIITIFIGILTVLATLKRDNQLNLQQAFLFSTLAWIGIAFFGSIPFFLSNLDLTFSEAFFESMSGITTTGSTVISNLDETPKSILIWRAIMQWLGGVGIIVMATTVLPLLKVGGMQVFKTDSSEPEKLLPKTIEVASVIILIYTTLTISCMAIYWLQGMTVFDSVAHALTTLATGGFSTHNESIGYFKSPGIEFTSIVFIILGSLPFITYLKFIKGNRKIFFTDIQIKGFIYLVIISITIMFLYLFLNNSEFSFIDNLRISSFNVLSILSGTGYVTDDFGLWGEFPLIFFLFLMFIGGCAGSTTCGIKIFRLQILFLFIGNHIKKLVYPNSVFIINYNKQKVEDTFINSVIIFIFSYLLLFLIISILLSISGLDFLSAISGSATSISNVGPGLGDMIGPNGNFSQVSDISKWILSFAMLLGRLEIFAVLVLFLPSFWRS